MPCSRLRNELEELLPEEVCIGLTPRLDDRPREEVPLDEPVRLEEVLELGEVLELLPEALGREPPVPLIRSCMVA